MTSQNKIKRRVGGKIGDNIKKALRKRNKTQRWLSDQLDVTYQHVNKWCTNKNKPNSEYLKEIADVLDYKVQEIVTGNFYEDMEAVVNESHKEYLNIIEDEKIDIRTMLDVLSSDPDLSEKQKEAYKKAVMKKLDMIINLVT